MKKSLLFFAFLFFGIVSCFSQGTLRGKIADETGEFLIGATVYLKSNPSSGVLTDFDGNYSVKIPDSSAHIIVVSYISYKTLEQTIKVANGKVVVKDFIMKSSANNISEIVITAKAVKSNETYMEKMKVNSANTIDYVSTETMKKTGDASVVAGVARISGVSTNNGLITVRGIGDRYVKTTVNGSRIPTLDPFTNNIRLDMFPASLVDNIIITKTASPDLPGDWAGAYLSVETKDYPDELTVNVESSVGYNNQSSFKDVLTSEKSKTDWLGFDDGLRNHDHSTFVNVNADPTVFEELKENGLADYYKSIGVTNETPWNESYLKLGLIQLGLLNKSDFDNQEAFSNAQKLYATGEYKNQAFNKINEKASVAGQSFPANWNTQNQKGPLNFTQSFTIGNQTTLFGKPLGVLLGYRYGNTTQYDPSSTANRPFGARTANAKIADKQIEQQVSRENNGWSALLNLAYKFTPNNSVSFLFMPNFSGANNIRNGSDIANSPSFIMTKSLFYEQRKQMIYQFKSEHFIPGSKIKIESNASYTNGSSSAPDFKNLTYEKNIIQGQTTYSIGGSYAIDRYFRYLNENMFDSRLSLEMPLGEEVPGLTRKLKFGGAYQYNYKLGRQYDYSLRMGPNFYLQPSNDDFNNLFSLNNFQISKDPLNPFSSLMKLYYAENGLPSNNYFGRSNIYASYAMLDYSIIPSLRVSGGLRMEKAAIYTDLVKYDSLGYAPNDLRRKELIDVFLVNPGVLNQTSFLPSANIVYKIKNDEFNPINLRFNYSKTIARPSTRELTETIVYDYELRANVFGNSNLKSVQIHNYDMRLESYFNNGDNISLSLFYKDFKNHIEMVQNPQGYSWQNIDNSKVRGIELEGRKSITKKLDFRANVTFVNSNNKIARSSLIVDNGFKTYLPFDTVVRPMLGQAPFIINGILSYNHDSIGLNLTLSYNVQGPRLVISSVDAADVYELARNLVDFKISKRIGKHFSASFTVRDILNSPIRRSHKYEDAGWILDYDKYTFGTNYVFGISYKL